MATEAEFQASLMEFEQNRNQLNSLANQKQQLQIQATALQQALDELEKSKEKKVLKNVGPVLISAPTDDVKKDLGERIESINLRLKTVSSQEQNLTVKMNKLKHELETEIKSRRQ